MPLPIGQILRNFGHGFGPMPRDWTMLFRFSWRIWEGAIIGDRQSTVFSGLSEGDADCGGVAVGGLCMADHIIHGFNKKTKDVLSGHNPKCIEFGFIQGLKRLRDRQGEPSGLNHLCKPGLDACC